VRRLEIADIRQRLQPGVYRLVAPVPEIASAVQAAGWSARALPPVSDAADFYAEISDRLGFVAGFGANLDALWDGLTDLDVPTALVLSGWDRFATDQPEQSRRIMEVLVERTQMSPAFAVIVA
jgi:RNAse (barnase) inhibitor barstar